LFSKTHDVVLVQMLVRYKPSIPDPQKKNLNDSLSALGYKLVSVVDNAKFFQMKFTDCTLRRARADAREAGEKLLANPVTEIFEIIKVEPTSE
jgi:phosphoribosylformylglycinamidine synthase